MPRKKEAPPATETEAAARLAASSWLKLETAVNKMIKYERRGWISRLGPVREQVRIATEAHLAHLNALYGLRATIAVREEEADRLTNDTARGGSA